MEILLFLIVFFLIAFIPYLRTRPEYPAKFLLQAAATIFFILFIWYYGRQSYMKWLIITVSLYYLYKEWKSLSFQANE